MQKLAALDANFLYSESEKTPNHISSVQLFDLAGTSSALVQSTRNQKQNTYGTHAASIQSHNIRLMIEQKDPRNNKLRRAHKRWKTCPASSSLPKSGAIKHDKREIGLAK